MQLTVDQISKLVIIERVASCLSIVSTIFVLVTFITIKDLRTLSNTLIFCASPANLFANVACLIGDLGILAGPQSPLCQFQAFMVEMFMPSDALWSLAMAVNVYLVFFRRFDATSLKKLYWIYVLLCYGIPFIPAITCLLINDPVRGKIYGDATLWCWIGDEWAFLRIYADYAFVWASILVTFVIYTCVGFKIFKIRRQIQAVVGYESSSFTTDPEPFSGFRTTEIQISCDDFSNTGIGSPTRIFSHPHIRSAKDQYSITISSPRETRPSILPWRRVDPPPKRTSRGVDQVKWAYAKCALLFAISILVTWVPASVNRVYGLINPTKPSFGLSVASAIVLPLQGFWNMAIYFTTSSAICKACWARWDLGGKKRWKWLKELESVASRKTGKDSDSTTDLRGASE